MSKEISRSCRLAAASGLCLAVAGIPALGAEHTFDGVYSGKRILAKGPSAPTCAVEDDVSVIIHGETLTFTNSAFKKFVLSVYPSKDGSFGNIYTGEGGGAVQIRGHIDRDVIEADVTNPHASITGI
jgi:hypothetical protein